MQLLQLIGRRTVALDRTRVAADPLHRIQHQGTQAEDQCQCDCYIQRQDHAAQIERETAQAAGNQLRRQVQADHADPLALMADFTVGHHRSGRRSELLCLPRPAIGSAHHGLMIPVVAQHHRRAVGIAHFRLQQPVDLLPVHIPYRAAQGNRQPVGTRCQALMEFAPLVLADVVVAGQAEQAEYQRQGGDQYDDNVQGDGCVTQARHESVRQDYPGCRRAGFTVAPAAGRRAPAVRTRRH